MLPSSAFQRGLSVSYVRFRDYRICGVRKCFIQHYLGMWKMWGKRGTGANSRGWVTATSRYSDVW
jgi:hypothetical protein